MFKDKLVRVKLGVWKWLLKVNRYFSIQTFIRPMRWRQLVAWLYSRRKISPSFSHVAVGGEEQGVARHRWHSDALTYMLHCIVWNKGTVNTGNANTGHNLHPPLLQPKRGNFTSDSSRKNWVYLSVNAIASCLCICNGQWSSELLCAHCTRTARYWQ
jgi:hypothetical protein